MNLFQRVKLVAAQLAGSQAALGGQLKLSARTFQGYMTAKREHNLWPLLTHILALYPQISREWLYFGEGKMIAGPESPQAMKAKNSRGHLVGDLLAVALDFARLTPEEAARESGLELATLEALLASRTKPTFDQLEALYRLGLNPAYLFTGNEYWMWCSRDPLSRVMMAVPPCGRSPSPDLMADIFDLDLDEAREFFKEREAALEEGRCLPVPHKWLQRLKEKYQLNTGWVNDDGLPRLALEERPKAAQAEKQVVAMAAEIADLRSRLKDKEEIIALQKRLLPSDSGWPETGKPTDLKEAAAAGSPAPGAPTDYRRSE